MLAMNRNIIDAIRAFLVFYNSLHDGMDSKQLRHLSVCYSSNSLIKIYIRKKKSIFFTLQFQKNKVKKQKNKKQCLDQHRVLLVVRANLLFCLSYIAWYMPQRDFKVL